MCQLGERPPEIVRPHLDAQFLSVELDDREHSLRRQPVGGNMAVSGQASEYRAFTQVRLSLPSRQRIVNPGRDWNSSDPTVFPEQINDHPAAVSLLNHFEIQTGQLTAPDAGAEEYREQGGVADPLIV